MPRAGTARAHSGDPSLYGATGEQMSRLDALGSGIVPGVPTYAKVAAVLKRELTLLGGTQTVILTRTAMKSSPVLNDEDIETLGMSGGTLALHLSVRNLKRICKDLTPRHGPDCPVAVVHRASWPDERVVRCTLADIRRKVRAAEITRTVLVIVGRALDPDSFRD